MILDSQGTGFIPPYIFEFLVLAIFYAVIRQHAGRKVDAREAPVVQSWIPYIGHLLGMAIYGGRYTKQIACRKHCPIFTLPMPGVRMCIVMDPALAATVQKTKSLSFNPIIPEVTQRILGLDEPTVRILKTNIGREHAADGFYPQVHDLVYSTMTPGARLDDLVTRATNVFEKHLLAYAGNHLPYSETSQVEDLLQWTQHVVTMATADLLYGPRNPIASNPSLEQAFWDFDHGLGRLLLFAGLAPSITAYKAYKGREAMIAALIEYFEQGHHESASPLIRERIEIAKRYGMSLDGVARSELSFIFAGIVNTAITSFWLILHIFARPDLLEAVRAELQHSCRTEDTSEAEYPKLDTSAIVNDCPILVSTYREVLRTRSDNSSNRLVTSDTLLADTYFLQKGSIVQISGAAMHLDPRIWGEDVNEFDPYRFQADKLRERSVHPSAFRAFGGGTTICPGRHFATREILYFVALFVLMFEMESADGIELRVPGKKDNVLPVHILEPRERVLVRLKRRQSNKQRG